MLREERMAVILSLKYYNYVERRVTSNLIE